MCQFSWVSLVDTLNSLAARIFEARIPPGTIGLWVTPALEHTEYLEGVFPRVKWMSLVADMSRLSSNFIWRTGTAITATSLDNVLMFISNCMQLSSS